MKKLGIILIVLTLALLSPLADFLPVDLWQSVKNLFEGVDSQTTYLKVVPSESNFDVFLFVLLAVGIGMILIDRFGRGKK
jgi:hypothetical protein